MTSPKQFFIFFSLLALIAGPENSRSQDFGDEIVALIYVSANSGEAAGGHIGLRLGEYVYHYQFTSKDLFVLARDPWTLFQFLYTELGNRPLSLLSLDVTEKTAVQLKKHFSFLLQEQRKQFFKLNNLQDEMALLKQILDDGSELTLPGAGFFNTSVDSNNIGASVDQIAKNIGIKYLQKQLERVEWELTQHCQEIDGEVWGRQLNNLLQRRFFIMALLGRYGLTPTALITRNDELNNEKYLVLERLQKQLADNLVQIFESDKAGGGDALLIQLARLQAVELSLEKGILYTLDPFPENVEKLEITEELRGADVLTPLVDALQKNEEKLWDTLSQTKFGRTGLFAELEALEGRVYELEKVLAGEEQARISRKRITPLSDGTIINPIDSKLFFSQFSERLMYLGDTVQALNEKIEKEINYHLFGDNCAVKLMKEINMAMESHENSSENLGGWVVPGEQFSFSPYMLYQVVKNRYQVIEEIYIPSRRLRELAAKIEREGIGGWLEEFNTITSELYTIREKDSAFLFFTDDVFIARPILGLGNTCYGILYSMVSLFNMGNDGGERVKHGFRGVLYSIPELFFINIRKGSYFAPDYSFLENSP